MAQRVLSGRTLDEDKMEEGTYVGKIKDRLRPCRCDGCKSTCSQSNTRHGGCKTIHNQIRGTRAPRARAYPYAPYMIRIQRDHSESLHDSDSKGSVHDSDFFGGELATQFRAVLERFRGNSRRLRTILCNSRSPAPRNETTRLFKKN